MLQAIHYKGLNGVRAFRRWVIPIFNSMIHNNQFRPVLCYLFTEWRCNIDCHYCFQYNNDLDGMDLDKAKSAVDWLKTLGCRVIPLMGGEPLLRKDFVLEIIRYGAENGFFMYLPTNGYLLDKTFIHEVGLTKRPPPKKRGRSEMQKMRSLLKWNSEDITACSCIARLKLIIHKSQHPMKVQ